MRGAGAGGAGSLAVTDAVSTLAPVRVSVLNAHGFVDTTATNTITLRLRLPDGEYGQLQGTVTRRAVEGVATSSDLQIHYALPGFVLEAATDGLAGAASAAFDIASGPPAAIVPDDRMQDPFEGAAGSTLVIVVLVADAYGNGISSDVVVPVNFAVTAGGGTVDPASAETTSYGEAHTTLTLGPEPGPNVVEVTSDALPGAKLVLSGTGLGASP